MKSKFQSFLTSLNEQNNWCGNATNAPTPPQKADRRSIVNHFLKSLRAKRSKIRAKHQPAFKRKKGTQKDELVATMHDAKRSSIRLPADAETTIWM